MSISYKDHTRSLKDIVRAGIPTYMSEGTSKAEKIEHHGIKVIENKKQFRIGSLKILPFDIQHDAEEPFGFLVSSDNGKRMIFATDTYYIKYKFKDLNIIAIECNYSQEILDNNIENGYVPEVMKKRLMQSHFSLENVINFLKANDLSKVEEIHLLHLSDTNSNEEEFKKKIKEVTGKRVIVA